MIRIIKALEGHFDHLGVSENRLRGTNLSGRSMCISMSLVYPFWAERPSQVPDPFQHNSLYSKAS